MKILRVFPHRTNWTPDDELVCIGEPPLWIPNHDEVHISCTFTWDMDYCEFLKTQWEVRTEKPVKLGGVAYGSPVTEFVPGRYIKKGVTFTSRGCNNGCAFCVVPKVEGKLQEIEDFPAGNIIQDNNFLQCSREHKERVFEMLKTQSGICFKGGLQPDLIDDHFVSNIKKLRIKELWLACDNKAAIPRFLRGCKKLTDAGYGRNQIMCYCLCGKDMVEEEERMRTVFKAGAMPVAQLFQPYERKKIEYPHEWKVFQRQWSRPAIIKANMRRQLNDEQ